MIVINDYWVLKNNKEIIELSRTEYLILEYLSIYSFGTLKRLKEYICSGYYMKEFTNSAITTAISRMRKKLQGILEIKTKNTLGYMLPENENIYFIYTVNMNGDKNDNKKKSNY